MNHVGPNKLSRAYTNLVYTISVCVSDFSFLGGEDPTELSHWSRQVLPG